MRQRRMETALNNMPRVGQCHLMPQHRGPAGVTFQHGRLSILGQVRRQLSLLLVPMSHRVDQIHEAQLWRLQLRLPLSTAQTPTQAATFRQQLTEALLRWTPMLM